MKDLLKTSIRPVIIGSLFYLFILLGHNADFISNDAIRTWTVILAGAIFMYLIVYAAINRKESFAASAAGFYITHFLFSLGMPVFLIINHVFFTDPIQKQPRSLLEKEQIELKLDPAECQKIKYGSFLS